MDRIDLVRPEPYVWHSTSVDRVDAILRSGAIFRNDGTRVRPAWGFSEGQRLNAVCLFDLRFVTDEKMSEARRHVLAFTYSKEATIEGSQPAVWIAIDPEKIGPLIRQGTPAHQAVQPEGERSYAKRIVHVECWLQSDIPVSAFRGYRLFSGPALDESVWLEKETPDLIGRMRARVEQWGREADRLRKEQVAAGGIDLTAAIAEAQARRSKPPADDS